MDDRTFRMALVVVFAALVPIGAYSRIGSVTKERLDRRQEGMLILVGLRLSGLVLFAGGIAWMIDPRSMAWSSVAIPVWLRWVGVVAAVCAGVLVAWTFQNLGNNLTDTVVTRKEHRLVTSGPYRYVRHPFYLAYAVGFVSVSVVMANWFVLLSGVVVLGFLVSRTRIEEEKLVERFGDEYRGYMQRVGRFVPWFRR